jgi:hypothetical protein
VPGEYYPDNWVIIKITNDDPHYRVLAGWSGGYLNGNSWRMNSGITDVSETSDAFVFKGASGSRYVCGKECYGIRVNNVYIWDKLRSIYGEKVEMMPEETDWSKLEWIIK